jgi:hypothetical protein
MSNWCAASVTAGWCHSKRMPILRWLDDSRDLFAVCPPGRSTAGYIVGDKTTYSWKPKDPFFTFMIVLCLCRLCLCSREVCCCQNGALQFSFLLNVRSWGQLGHEECPHRVILEIIFLFHSVDVAIPTNLWISLRQKKKIKDWLRLSHQYCEIVMR